MGERRRALVVGLGLIGGSVALALRAAGWVVLGRDADEARVQGALESEIIDAVWSDGDDVELTVVATPVGSVPEVVAWALGATTGLVTDAGSVKTPMVPLMADARYVGGHPMAGSELEGLAGARADLFEGRTWVLTPVTSTDDDAFTEIRSIVAGFGAEVVSLAPERHDSMVAIVSHVPHLTAASLMGLAAEQSTEQRGLMRLAAGGFRDMTRIAAGHPGIWPDICLGNRDAILLELDRLVAQLSEVRDMVATDDRARLVHLLERARSARRALPARFAMAEDLAEVRVPIADQKGALAKVTTLATDLDVSIADIEIAHSVEGDEGVLILLVEAENGERLRDGLIERGYRAVVRPLGADER